MPSKDKRPEKPRDPETALDLLKSEALPDGKTRVSTDLDPAGSIIVLYTPGKAQGIALVDGKRIAFGGQRKEAWRWQGIGSGWLGDRLVAVGVDDEIADEIDEALSLSQCSDVGNALTKIVDPDELP